MVSTLKVDKIQSRDPATTTIEVASNLAFASGYSLQGAAGAIAQVQYSQFTDYSSDLDFTVASANTPVVSTNFNVTITPTSASSIIRIDVQVTGEWSVVGNTWDHMFLLRRDASTWLRSTSAQTNPTKGIYPVTTTYTSSDNNSTMEVASFSYFDAPSTTSATTYHLGVVAATAATYYVNTNSNRTDTTGREHGVSFISATEIVQ